MNIVHYDVIITRLVPFVNSFTKINHCYKKVPCFRTREIKINIHYPKESGNAPSDEQLYAPVWRRKLLIAVIAKCPRAKRKGILQLRVVRVTGLEPTRHNCH